jgi:arylsulfatase A-like enzyme
VRLASVLVAGPLLCGSLVVLAGCRALLPSLPEGETLALRFAEEEPATFFDPVLLVEEGAVFEWKAVRRPLRPGPVDVPLPGGALDAGHVQVIEVAIAGPRRDFRTRGAVRVSWVSDHGGEPRADLRLEGRSEVGEYEATYRFNVGDDPRWVGRITRLRVEPSTTPGEGAVLRSVRALEWQSRPSAWPAVGDRAWRIRIGDEVRTGFVALDGSSLRRALRVPPRATLRFGYGCPEPTQGLVTFEVVAGMNGEPGAVVFSQAVGPGGRPPGAWHEGSVDLSPWTGRLLHFTLRVRRAAGAGAPRGTPAWGTPEVWTAGRPRPPSVVLISIDTLRADHLSLYGHKRATSPNLDRWARERGIVFDTAVAPSPWTLPSHASLFTGLNAVRHGVNQGYPLPRTLPTISEAFRRAGYATVAVTGGIYLSPEFAFDRGFDSFTAWRGGEEGELRAGLERALAQLDRLGDRPFFLFFHTYEVHAPYWPREPYYSQFGGELPMGPTTILPAAVPPRADDGFVVRQRVERDGREATAEDVRTLRRLYDAGVAYTDAHIGRLLARLQALPRPPIVIVTSDHGEALGERGLASHNYLYDFNLRVPLVVSAPGLRARRVSSQVRLIDVPPTLTDLAGLPPLPDIDGTSLRPLLTGSGESIGRDAWSYAASTNQGIALRADGRWSYIFNNTAWPSACGHEELYDLGVDRGERNNLAPAEPARAFRERVAEHLKAWSAGLLVRFQNAGPSPFAGAIAAPFLHQVRAKTWGVTCPRLGWQEDEGRIDFRVEPGERFEVVLEAVANQHLRIVCERENTGVEMDPASLGRPHAVAWTGHRCVAQPEGSSAPPVGLTVQWIGDPRAQHAARPPADSDVLEQLRALGYVQ